MILAWKGGLGGLCFERPQHAASWPTLVALCVIVIVYLSYNLLLGIITHHFLRTSPFRVFSQALIFHPYDGRYPCPRVLRPFLASLLHPPGACSLSFHPDYQNTCGKRGMEPVALCSRLILQICPIRQVVLIQMTMRSTPRSPRTGTTGLRAWRQQGTIRGAPRVWDVCGHIRPPAV